jgi:hypothetical protein
MRRVTSSPPFGGCYETFAGPDELHGNMASGMQARWSGVTRLGRLLAQAALPVRLAGRRGLCRALGVDTALVEPERRIVVGHQCHINQ